jgi:hypothetical protein
VQLHFCFGDGSAARITYHASDPKSLSPDRGSVEHRNEQDAGKVNRYPFQFLLSTHHAPFLRKQLPPHG